LRFLPLILLPSRAPSAEPFLAAALISALLGILKKRNILCNNILMAYFPSPGWPFTHFVPQ